MSVDSDQIPSPPIGGRLCPPGPANGVRAGTTVRVFSNLRKLPTRVGDFRIENDCRVIDNKIKLAIIAYLKSFRKHAVILHQPDTELYILCALRAVLPGRAKLITVDQILIKPGTTLLERLKAAVKRVLLRQVDLFILYQKDTDGLRQHYGVPAERTCFIPFKVNSFESLSGIDTAEKGYVFSGGRSRRDYATLFEAMSGLPYPALVLVPGAAESAYHGTSLDGAEVPGNVKIVHDDGSARSWNQHIAGSKLVVFPISPDAIGSAGVGAYLLAMALGKCVIITDCPAVKDILEDREHAVIVPKQDPAAMRDAIRRAWEDDEYRGRIAEKGREYALSLEGVERLNENIARASLEFLERPGS